MAADEFKPLSDQKAAAAVLSRLALSIGDEKQIVEDNPVVKIARMSLAYIAMHGGKVDASLVGMLCMTAERNAHDALVAAQKASEVHRDTLGRPINLFLPHSPPAIPSVPPSHGIAIQLANDLIDANLVQLPILSKRLGIG